VSTHVQCPACGRPAANIAEPDERSGTLYDGREIDRGFNAGNEDRTTYTFQWDDGRETFECSCGRAIWIANRRIPDGRWFVSERPAPAQDHGN
jgi:hypothetical protein